MNIVTEGNEADDYALLVTQLIAIVGVFGVVIGYSVSFGPLTWLLILEILPSIICGWAIGAAKIISYTSAFIVQYTFMTFYIEPSLPFAIYSVLVSMSIAFAHFAINSRYSW